MAQAAPLQTLKVKVASPCQVGWDSMQGDDQVRHCGLCQKNVYNLSGLTQDEAIELLMERGEVCVTFFEREDGTVMTEDCPVGLAAARRDLARYLVKTVAASAAAAALALGGMEAVSDPPGGYDAFARKLPVIGSVINWIDPAKAKPADCDAPKKAGQYSTRKNITGFASQSTHSGS